MHALSLAVSCKEEIRRWSSDERSTGHARTHVRRRPAGRVQNHVTQKKRGAAPCGNCDCQIWIHQDSMFEAKACIAPNPRVIAVLLKSGACSIWTFSFTAQCLLIILRLFGEVFLILWTRSQRNVAKSALLSPACVFLVISILI